MDRLIEPCAQCGGAGKARPRQESHGAIDKISSDVCPTCNGKGRVLTEAGKAVSEVMQHVVAGGR